MIPTESCLLSPWFFAYVLVSRCDSPARRTTATAWLHACLAAGIGLGLSSCTYFVWLLCFGPPGRVYWIVETLGFVGGGLLGLATSRPRHATTVMPAVAASSPFVRRWQAIVVAIFIAALAFDVVGMAGRYVACPQGGWDAWAIWNCAGAFSLPFG